MASIHAQYAEQQPGRDAVQVSNPSALLSLGSAAFVSTFSTFAGTVLGLNASLVTVSDYVLTPGSVLSSSATAVGMAVEFLVQPPDSFSSQQVRGWVTVAG